MADLPPWLLAILGQQQAGTSVQGGPAAFDPNNPQTGGGLLAGAMPPQLGGLLTAPKPVPTAPGTDDVSGLPDQNNIPLPPSRPTDLGMQTGLSAATGPSPMGTAQNAANIPSGAINRSNDGTGANVIGTPASGTTEASSPGIMDRLSSLANAAGGIYGAGGPGDALIALGLSNRTNGASVNVLNAMSGKSLNDAKLQAFKLQVAQQQAGQTATASYLKSKGATDAEVTAAINGAAAGQGDLLKNLITQYSGNDKNKFFVRPDNSIVAQDTQDLTKPPQQVVGPQDPDTKPFVMGQDMYSRPIYGTMKNGVPTPLDPSQTVAPGTGAGTTTGAPDPATMNLHGDDYIKTLNPSMQNQVRAIVEGRSPYPTGMLLKTPYGQQLADMVTQADPTFESGNAASRTKLRQAFTSGGPNLPAGTINAGNTAIQHLGHLSDAAESLNNSTMPIYNSVANAVKTGSGGGLPVVDFKNIVNKYTEEATKFYRGTGGSEADITRELESLNPNQSPDQLRTAIKTQAELLKSKVNALQDQWKNGMGPLVNDFPILGKESQSSLDRIDQRAQKIGGGQSASSAPTAAPTMASASATPSGGDDPLAAARAAIAQGAPRQAVMNRLLQNGINPAGL